MPISLTNRASIVPPGGISPTGRPSTATSSGSRERLWIVSRSPGGELVVQGRSKELIIRSGFNVYPPEIEAVLNSHPAVLNSAVVGRSIEGNEEIIAFVEPTPGSTIEVAELLALVERQLAPYKKPQQIIVLPQLPVAPNGKIRKHDLKKRAEESLSAATSV